MLSLHDLNQQYNDLKDGVAPNSLPKPPATPADMWKPHSFKRYQHQMTSLSTKASFLNLLQRASVDHRATLKSLSMRGAGSFLTNIKQTALRPSILPSLFVHVLTCPCLTSRQQTRVFASILSHGSTSTNSPT